MQNTIEQATSVVCQKKSSLLKYAVQIIVVILLFVGLCSAQTQFVHAVGGASRDWGNSIVQTFDGGYIVTGRTVSSDSASYDLFLVKFNSFGVLTWAKTVGGADLDCGHSVAQTFDRGYIVTGRTGSFGAGELDLFLVKFNPYGDLTWAKTVGGADNDEGNSVAQTSDRGYIVTGGTESFGAGSHDLFLGKFNSSGDLTWAKTVGGALYDIGISVAQTSDNGYIVNGDTRSFGAGDFDLFLSKFNSSGDLTWAKTVGGTNCDWGNSVVPTFDGRYIITGETYSFGAGCNDLFLVKFNSSGDLTWAKTVGGALCDRGNSVTPTFDGGYAVTGRTTSFGSGWDDLFLGKFNSSGEIEDCGYIADCSPVVGSPSLSSVSVSPFITTLSLSAVSCSPTVTIPSPTVTEVCADISEPPSKPTSFELIVSPNPFNSSCAITTPECATVEIYDLQGRLVWNKPSDSDNIGATSLIKGGKPEAVPLNKGDVAKRQGVNALAQWVFIWQPDVTISSGVYLVRATTDDEQQITKRVVYLK